MRCGRLWECVCEQDSLCHHGANFGLRREAGGQVKGDTQVVGSAGEG